MSSKFNRVSAWDTVKVTGESFTVQVNTLGQFTANGKRVLTSQDLSNASTSNRITLSTGSSITMSNGANAVGLAFNRLLVGGAAIAANSTVGTVSSWTAQPDLAKYKIQYDSAFESSAIQIVVITPGVYVVNATVVVGPSTAATAVFFGIKQRISGVDDPTIQGASTLEIPATTQSVALFSSTRVACAAGTILRPVFNTSINIPFVPSVAAALDAISHVDVFYDGAVSS